MSACIHPIKGITVHDPTRAYDGYTLFCHTHEGPRMGRDLYAYPMLIDMQGNVVHQWQLSTACQLLKLAPNGDLYYTTRDRSSIDQAGLYRLEPDSTVLWRYHCRIDHDFFLLASGNLMIHTISDYMVPRLGRGLRRHPYFLEINLDGDLIWEWRGDEHLDELENLLGLQVPIDWGAKIKREFALRAEWEPGVRDAVADALARMKAARMASFAFDWAHNNTCQVIGENAAGAIDARFRPGNIVFSYRTLDIIGVIDRDTSEIVWAWGPGEIDGQHKPHMLPNGHILVFDNGTCRGWSRIVEMDPLTNTIVWEYAAEHKPDFYSGFISGAQRLPNGNTLICEGARGRLFEVTIEGDIVWEFRSPYRGFISGREAHNIYRANRYSPEYVAPLLSRA